MAVNISRRELVSAGAVATTAFVAGGSAAMAGEAAATDSPSFDASYDVVVCGYGFAGAMAAIAAADNGAKVLLVDRAPKGQEGGNSRFCAQIAVYGHDEDDLLAYYRALGWQMEQDDDVLKAYVHGLASMPSYFERLGVPEPVVWKDYLQTEESKDNAMVQWAAGFMLPEYPELVEEGQTVDCVTVNPTFFDGALYPHAQETVEGIEAIEVWLESPATRLVQDPATRRILGVVIEHEGAEVAVEARSGVVLATGGFECNMQMVQDYLGMPRVAPIGGLHNFGDGIRMAQEVGADLWHMWNYESLGGIGGNGWEVEPGMHASLGSPTLQGAVMVVAEDGTRYYDETADARHGHIYQHGIFRIPSTSNRPHLVFDEAYLAFAREQGNLPDDADDRMLSGSTPAELAEKIGADPELLARTIRRFNDAVANGEDVECDRPVETMAAFEEGALYALPLVPNVLNTQGGPRRNARAQVIAIDGTPIPGLFSAGECGGVNAFYYNGGGNVGECLVFGEIAGRNAAAGL